MHTKTINLKVQSERTCPVVIGYQTLNQLGSYLNLKNSQKIAIISNPTVSKLYYETIKQQFNNQCLLIEVEDSEKSKDFSVVKTILDKLLEEKFERQDLIIALGGGVIGDLAGFVASIYLRGIKLIQVPTTLLSQVDSSVGGKTGVNHPAGKNLIGTFYQPHVTYIDVKALSTLPERQCLCGLAEVIKYGVICDAEFFHLIDKNKEMIKAFNFEQHQDLFTALIYRSCENKAKVVEADEKEAGLRAILNYGHTFAHAIESTFKYGTYQHGEAVAIGMVAAAKLSEQLSLLSSESANKIVELIKYFNFPKKVSSVSPDLLIDKMFLDKKVKDGSIQFVLPTDIGSVKQVGNIERDLIKDTLIKHVIE